MKGMKRILLIFMFGAMFLFVILAPVHATTDKSFTTVRLNKFGSVVIRVGQAIGFDISGLITPIFNKEKQIAAPNHEPTATWKAAFNEYFTPQSYRDDGKHVNWDADANPVFYTALYGAILKADAEHSNHPDPTDCYISTNPEKSADVPFAPLDFQKAREADAWLGTNPVNPDTNGVVDFNLPSKTIGGMNSGEDCKKHEAGFERDPLENNLRALSQFGTGTLIEGHEITDIFTIITKWVIDHWVEETIWKEEPKYNEVLLTMKKNLPWYHIKTHDGGGPEDEAGEYSGNSAISGGWTAFTLREEDKKPVVPASLQPYEIKILEFPQKTLEASYDLMNIAQVRMQQAACYVTPYTPKNNPQADAALGGIIKIQDECQPKTELCDEADTWEEIVQKLQKSLNDAAAQYAAYFPISSSQLVDLMNVIFTIEVGNDNTLNPELGGSYVCEENSAGAAGPFQIKTETYGDITNNCQEEYMPDDLTGCKTKETQLSRCITEDAAILAIRAMLYSAGRWVHTPNQCTNREFRIANMSELYTAVCNYGEGDTILPHLGNKTYCEYVFDTLGWTKP